MAPNPWYVLENAAEIPSPTLVLHRSRIDLLLTDVVMPGADGFAVAATLSGEIPELRVLIRRAVEWTASGKVTP
jgi:CheY-like chemotaxis protein